MATAITMIVAFIFIYGLCWALHCFSNYLDFDKPAKEEAKYKKNIERKYNIPGGNSRTISGGQEKKNLKVLEAKAKAFADDMVNNTIGLTEDTQQKLRLYYYHYYMDKYKLQYS